MQLRRAIPVAAAGALVVIASALGNVGGQGSGPPAITNAPDLRTASIVRSTRPGEALGAQVKYCFDDVILSASAARFAVGDYESDRSWVGVTTSAPDSTKCVTVTFAAGADIDQASVAGAETGGVVGIGGQQSVIGTAPLEGSVLQPVAGAVTAPDLVRALPDPATRQVAYFFDENLNAPRTYDPARFGFYTDGSDGSALITAAGGAIVDVYAKSITVEFPPAVTNVADATRFVALAGAVQDQPTGTLSAVSLLGVSGSAISGSPNLDMATESSEPHQVNLFFDGWVDPASVSGVAAYREDGTRIGATALSGASAQVLVATFPAEVDVEPASVVRVSVDPTAAVAHTGGRHVTYGTAAIGTCRCTPGYTDGPDLMSTVVHDESNLVDYVYDEPLRANPPPDPARFFLVDPDGLLGPTFDPLTVGENPRIATAHFSESVTAGVGVVGRAGAVADTTSQANSGPTGAVGVAPPQCPQLGRRQDTCAVGTVAIPSATATPAATTTPSPSATVSPAIVLTSKISLRRRRHGTRYLGRVAGGGYSCASGRKVRLYRGAERLKTTTTSKIGAFRFHLKRQPKGRVRAKVDDRFLNSGHPVRCVGATSRRV